MGARAGGRSKTKKRGPHAPATVTLRPARGCGAVGGGLPPRKGLGSARPSAPDAAGPPAARGLCCGPGEPAGRAASDEERGAGAGAGPGPPSAPSHFAGGCGRGLGSFIGRGAAGPGRGQGGAGPGSTLRGPWRRGRGTGNYGPRGRATSFPGAGALTAAASARLRCPRPGARPADPLPPAAAPPAASLPWSRQAGASSAEASMGARSCVSCACACAPPGGAHCACALGEPRRAPLAAGRSGAGWAGARRGGAFQTRLRRSPVRS